MKGITSSTYTYGQKTPKQSNGMARAQGWPLQRTSSTRMKYNPQSFLGIVDFSNNHQTGDIKRLNKILPPIVKAASAVYTDIPLSPAPSTVLSRFLSGSTAKADGFASLLPSSKLHPLRDTINEVRAFKSDAEIANMRKAGQASGRAFTDIMRQTWTKEKDLCNALEYGFKTRGCDGSAYVPVVAGGKVLDL